MSVLGVVIGFSLLQFTHCNWPFSSVYMEKHVFFCFCFLLTAGVAHSHVIELAAHVILPNPESINGLML